MLDHKRIEISARRRNRVWFIKTGQVFLKDHVNKNTAKHFSLDFSSGEC